MELKISSNMRLMMYLLLYFISSSAAESGEENATYNPCLTANNDFFEANNCSSGVFERLNDLIGNGTAINTTYDTSCLDAGQTVWHQCPGHDDLVCVQEPNSQDAVDLATDKYINGTELLGVCTERSNKSQWVKLTLESNSGPDKEFVYVVANCSVVYCIRHEEQHGHPSCNKFDHTSLVGTIRHLVLRDTNIDPVQSTVSISPSQSSPEAPTTSELTRTVSISPSQSSPEAPTTSKLTSTCIQTTAELCGLSTSSTMTVDPTVEIDVLKSNEVCLSSSGFTGVIIVTASVTAGAIILPLIVIALVCRWKIKSANVKAQVCAPEPDMGGNTQENTQAADMELEESVRSNQQFIVPGTTS